MNIKKYLCYIFILLSTILLFKAPSVSAIIADYVETVARQKDSAQIVVEGRVISSIYEKEYDHTVVYKISVDRIIKGVGIENSNTIELRHNCSKASELSFPTTRAQCITDSPKIGDSKIVYFNYIDSKYKQAVIYEDEIENVDKTKITTSNQFLQSGIYIIIGAATLAIVGAVVFIIIRKSRKNK
ncbi:MAG: hypothetical protein WCQ49_02720 [Candidatus Saccharibacteria bacterium]